jgi:uncharacterized protein YndB with AHSA1/START domain
MSERATRTLRIERTFDAPADKVFEAWTSEEVLRRWFHVYEEWDTPTAEVDLRIGGEVRVVMRDSSDGTEHGARGHYTEIEPPRRLAMRWVFDDDPENVQTIELEFSERDGRTTVVMINSGISNERRRESQERGWNGCFDNLGRALARSS